MNHEIRITPIRLIDENNQQVGVVETREAMRMAEDAGLDLVEIQADVRPPLCKIMDYGKFRYEQSKKTSGQASGKAKEMKELRLGRSAKIDEHDVGIRVEQARRFLMDGHKVMFVQRFRGREMAHQGIGIRRLQEISDSLADVAKLEVPPRQAGRQMSMIMAPDRPKIEAIKRKMGPAANTPAPDDAAEGSADSESREQPTEQKQPKREFDPLAGIEVSADLTELDNEA